MDNLEEMDERQYRMILLICGILTNEKQNKKTKQNKHIDTEKKLVVTRGKED